MRPRKHERDHCLKNPKSRATEKSKHKHSSINKLNKRKIIN